MKKIEIVRKEIDDSHYYFVNGEFYPGVTTILDEAGPVPYYLKQWFLSQTPESAEKIKNDSAEFGSKLHDAYEKLLNGKELNLLDQYPTSKEKRHLASFYRWFEDIKPSNIKTEQVIASVKYKYAGTMDLCCTIADEKVIVDFKTGNSIHWSHGLQLAAYRQAYEEMTGEKIDRMFILRTGSKHKAGYEFKELTTPFDDFLNVYKTYLALHEGKIPEPPLIDVYPDFLKLELKEVNK